MVLHTSWVAHAMVCHDVAVWREDVVAVSDK